MAQKAQPSVHAGLDTPQLIAKISEEDANTRNLHFGFWPLMANHTIKNVAPGGTPPAAKAPPTLETFKGTTFPKLDSHHTTLGLVNKCARFYRSKKGSVYGFVLFFLKGAIPPIGTIFIAMMTHEMHHPVAKDTGILILHGCCLILCFTLSAIVEWLIVCFKQTWGLAGALMPLLDNRFMQMKGDLAVQWTPTHAMIVIESLLQPGVATFFGSVMYTLFSGYVSAVLCVVMTFVHMHDHLGIAFILVAIILMDFGRKIPYYRYQRSNKDSLALYEAKSRNLMLEFMQSRIRRGRAVAAHEGKCEDEAVRDPRHPPQAFHMWMSRHTQHFHYSAAHALVDRYFQKLMTGVMLTVGGVGVLHNEIALTDLAAMISVLHIAGHVGDELSDQITTFCKERPALETIINILNLEIEEEKEDLEAQASPPMTGMSSI